MSDKKPEVPPMMISGFHGNIDPVTGESLVYLGVVHKMPISDYGKDRSLTVETEFSGLQNPILGSDGTLYTPAANQVVERYESLDPKTGEIWVMYRLPFVPQPDRSKSHN